MSGISGIFSLDGRSVQQSEIAAVTNAMRHRGPDGSSTWTQGEIALGHNLFRTTPESRFEQQPFWSEHDQLAITCDARIDNRDELIRALSMKRPNAEIPDSEIILCSYAEWGEHCPERLVGDFSFAIWNKRTETVFCARDRFGVKPFCYCILPGRFFAFATQIKALLELPVPRRLNEWLITELFEPTFEGFEQTASFYKDILRLEAACTLTVRRGGIETRRYWTLDPEREIRLRSDEEYVEAFRESFGESVRCRMRSAGDVGLLLSGGVDSASIAGTASRVAEETGVELHTFSGLAEKSCPEAPFVRAVLRNIPVRSHIVQSSEAPDYAGDYEEAMLNAAEPVEPTRNYLPRVLYRAAEKAGVPVVLDGVDGDYATSHDFTIPYLLRGGSWKAALSQSRELAKRLNVSPWSALRSTGLRPLAPLFMTRLWDRLHRRQRWNTLLFTPEYARRIGLNARIERIQREWFELKSDIRHAHAEALSCGILPFSYEQYDLTAAAIGVEARHPFSDHRLIEFCLSVPSEQKVRNGYSKALLRRAADPRIPDEVRWRVERPSSAPQFIEALVCSRRELLDQALKSLEPVAPFLDLTRLEQLRLGCEGNKHPMDQRLVVAAYLVLWLNQKSLTE